MKRLFIAEKPSVAMEFAKAIGIPSGNRQDGYIEGDNDIVTWCVGHLITMSYPDAYDESLKKWTLETLPFVPSKFRYQVINDVRKQYNIVKGLLNRKDIGAIYYSGDSAREGEYIQRLVRQEAGHNPNAQEFRVWIDSQTTEEILNGIKNAKPLSAYDTLSDSAYARAIEDYLVGMNFSRVLSIKYAGLVSNATGDKYRPIAVGRVMSCVLGMIVQREREIRDSVVFPFYGIKSVLTEHVDLDWKIVDGSRYKGSPDAYKDVGLLKKEPVETLVNEMQSGGVLEIVDKKDQIQKKGAPLLYNLAELQADCTKAFHIGPAETLEIVQKLYERKLVTYPRTDARVLTTAISKEIMKNISGLKKVPEVSNFAVTIIGNGWQNKITSAGTKYVDDSKVSDHYAIIPTGQGFENYASLSDLEKEVYISICKRFLAIFYPDAEIRNITVTGKASGETFTGSFSAIEKEGFMEIAGHKDDANDKEAIREILAMSGTVPSNFTLKEGKSQPPKRYTSGSMILAMENAGNLIDDPELREQIKGAGIGTSATRAEVISKLGRNGYIRVDKKTQTIFPTELGELIYDVLKEAVPQILNPKYTASWEKGLQGVTDGTTTKKFYLEKIYTYVTDGTNYMKNSDYTEKIKAAIQSLSTVYKNIKVNGYAGQERKSTGLNCPICGKEIRESEKGYYCSGFKEGCKFSIFKAMAGKALPKSTVDKLVNTTTKNGDVWESEVTDKVKGFKSKAGKSFDAKIKLTMAEGEYPKLNFVFDKR